MICLGASAGANGAVPDWRHMVQERGAEQWCAVLPWIAQLGVQDH